MNIPPSALPALTQNTIPVPALVIHTGIPILEDCETTYCLHNMYPLLSVPSTRKLVILRPITMYCITSKSSTLFDNILDPTTVIQEASEGIRKDNTFLGGKRYSSLGVYIKLLKIAVDTNTQSCVLVYVFMHEVTSEIIVSIALIHVVRKFALEKCH